MPPPTNPLLLLSTLPPLALSLTLALPSLSIPPPISNPPLSTSTTPFAQSKGMKLGLDKGKIRPCPAINPGCVSTNPKSSSFAFPWEVPEEANGDAAQRLKEAILETQKNVKFQVIEDTPEDGQLHLHHLGQLETTSLFYSGRVAYIRPPLPRLGGNLF